MTAAPRGRVGVAAVLTLVTWTVACTEGPVTTELPEVEVVVADGDGQYGVAGTLLAHPLRVVVRTLGTQRPLSEVSVRWTVERGDATVVGDATMETDSLGAAQVRLRLGAGTGEVVVRATVVVRAASGVSLRAFSVLTPVLTELSPTVAAPGDTLTLTGMQFSPTSSQNVVLFSGMRGRVVEASSSRLRVEVPPCLPSRDVSVTVQLGTVGSNARTLTVSSGGAPSTPSVGEVVDLDATSAVPCLRLGGGIGVRYLATLQSVSSVVGGRHPFTLTGLSAGPDPVGGLPLAARLGRAGMPFATGFAPASGGGLDAQLLWEEQVREVERAFRAGSEVPSAPSGPASAPSRPAPTPSRQAVIGDARTFQVYSGPDRFTEVRATVRHVGAKVILYVDDAAPAGGFSTTDLEDFAGRFDATIHPVVTGAFGTESDLDGNARVIVLFTPEVNELTPRGSSSFVGGFFFGLDLLRDRSNSNAGEIFYSLVPDPDGVHSDPRTSRDVLGVVPYVLAHEFQHMVHFNQRVLRLAAPDNEAVWLSEALAQMAEELVARQYLAEGRAVDAQLFRDGNRVRARRFLSDPPAVSLLVETGSVALAERGAGFLLLLYLERHYGADLPGRLTRTTRRGVASIEAQTGTPWATLVGDWWTALYYDGLAPTPLLLTYPGFDLRAFLGTPFPLLPLSLGGMDILDQGFVSSSSSRYYLVAPRTDGSFVLGVGGAAGAAIEAPSGVRLRVVRLP